MFSCPTVSATRASFLSECQASKFAFLQLCRRWCKETARCSLGMVIWKWTSLGTAQCPQSCSCHPQVLRCFRTALQTSAELRWKLRVRLLSNLYQRASALMYLVTSNLKGVASGAHLQEWNKPMLDGFKPSNNLGWDTMNKKEPLNTNWKVNKGWNMWFKGIRVGNSFFDPGLLFLT